MRKLFIVLFVLFFSGCHMSDVVSEEDYSTTIETYDCSLVVGSAPAAIVLSPITVPILYFDDLSWGKYDTFAWFFSGFPVGIPFAYVMSTPVYIGEMFYNLLLFKPKKKKKKD